MSDDVQLDADGSVLVVGGYGTVGAQLARLAAPVWPVVLAGRNPQAGSALAREVGAQTARWDTTSGEPFSMRARAVVSAVNDPDDRVLRAAVRGGVPYVDITRWTARLTRAAVTATAVGPTAPVLLSSAWMGGVSSLVVAALASEIGGASSVDIAIRYDTDDRAGVDSVEFMDRLDVDFEVVRDGDRVNVHPLSEVGRTVIGEYSTRVARIDTPEQYTLPLTLDTRTATTRIGFSSNSATSSLIALKRLGMFRVFGGKRWTGARRSLLQSSGSGGVAMMRVQVSHHGTERGVLIVDPAGQAHLTAVGALMGLRRVLGLDGSAAPAGVGYPEHHPRPDTILDQLQHAGVDVHRL